MADCKRCGRKLPFYSFSEICSECKAAMARFAREQGTTAERRISDTKPTVTTALLAINLIVFLAMVFSGVSPVNPKGAELLSWGANYYVSLTSQPWRLVTANFLHIGILHIAFNMWCLWDLGGLAERIFGGVTLFWIYICCGVSGYLVSLWWNPATLNAGASAAVFGIAGALIAALRLGNLPFPQHAVQSILKSLLTFAGYNLLFGFMIPFISNSAHIGGLLMGLLIGALLAGSLTAATPTRLLWQFGVLIVAAALLAGAFFYLRRQLFRTYDLNSAVRYHYLAPASSCSSRTMSTACPRTWYVVPGSPRV